MNGVTYLNNTNRWFYKSSRNELKKIILNQFRVKLFLSSSSLMTERREANDNLYCIFKMLRFLKGKKKLIR